MNEFLARAKEILPETIRVRRTIHQNGGVGFDLRPTVDFLKAELKNIGIEAEEIVDCGLTFTIGKGGKTILLRADIDALPMMERSGEEFACTNGSCHSCGHDLHGAGLFAAAKMLKERENELEGTVKFMFQPAEETLQGAKKMVEAGICEGVDAAMAIHVGSGGPKKTGHVHVTRGACYASGDKVTITVKGVGGHGAYPHSTNDPISIAASIILNVQRIQAREIPAQAMSVINFCSIHAGTAANITPESVEILGTIRTLDSKIREQALKRVKEVAEATAKMYNAEAVVEYDEANAPPVINDATLVNQFAEIFKETVGEENVEVTDNRSVNGSEDFAYVGEKVPAVMVSCACGCRDDGYDSPMHNPMVRFDENGLAYSSALYASTAFNWLKRNK